MLNSNTNKALEINSNKAVLLSIAIRNPSMGNTFLDMDETKTATKAQVNTIFDYISKFNRYDMNVSKVMAD